jgi:hypothetical protein
MRLRPVVVLLALAAIGVGCGSGGESSERRSEAHERGAVREARQARREVARQQAREQIEVEAEAEEAESECDPNYSGACLDPYASDYDCEGGSGNGPLYTGPVAVVGEDHYGLDSDGDRSACEPY